MVVYESLLPRLAIGSSRTTHRYQRSPALISPPGVSLLAFAYRAATRSRCDPPTMGDLPHRALGRSRNRTDVYSLSGPTAGASTPTAIDIRPHRIPVRGRRNPEIPREESSHVTLIGESRFLRELTERAHRGCQSARDPGGWRHGRQRESRGAGHAPASSPQTLRLRALVGECRGRDCCTVLPGGLSVGRTTPPSRNRK